MNLECSISGDSSLCSLSDQSIDLKLFQHDFNHLTIIAARIKDLFIINLDPFSQLIEQLDQDFKPLSFNISSLITMIPLDEKDDDKDNVPLSILKSNILKISETFQQVMLQSKQLSLSEDQQEFIQGMDAQLKIAKGQLNRKLEIPANLKTIIESCYQTAEKPQCKDLSLASAAAAPILPIQQGKRLIVVQQDPKLDAIFEPILEATEKSLAIAIFRILNNVLVNAATHGSYQIKIESVLESMDEESGRLVLVIKVSDTGAGIVRDFDSKAPDQVNQEAFDILTGLGRQGSESSIGSGLGGASLLKLIQGLRGSLNVLTRGGIGESGESFEGTKITLRIPVMKNHEIIIPIKKLLERVGLADIAKCKERLSKSGMRAIVVEDGDLTRKVVCRQLEEVLKFEGAPLVATAHKVEVV